MQSTHEKYMQRCLDLALQGMGNVAPNPMVGSVVVHNDRIIGEGYHQIYGQAHAEVNAINSVKQPELLKASTLYVNLEPCSHHGKTPPCSDLIIRTGIPRVVIGCVDSFAKVSGNGIKKLKAAGCDVTVGVLENESLDLNCRFFTFHSKKRPYVILKWAQTKDGYIDAVRTPNTPLKPLWITNELARMLVHKWRTEEPSILVGTNTAAKDNPKLNVRDWDGKPPLRLVLDRTGRLSKELNLFDGSAPTIVYTAEQQRSETNLEYVKLPFDDALLQALLTDLYERDIQSVIVEGGAQLLQSFMDADLWDEARVFIGNKFFYNGTKAPKMRGEIVKEELLGHSRLYIVKS